MKNKSSLLNKLNIDKDQICVSDVIILSVSLLCYFFTVIPLAPRFIAEISRYVVLPLFIILGYMKIKKVYADTATIVLFVLAVFPSIVFSPYFSNSVLKTATVLLMFFATSMFFYSRKEKGLQSLYYALLILSYIAVTLNFYRYLIGEGLSGESFRGFFGNRNGLGAVLVMCLVIFLAEAWRIKGFKRIIPFAFFVLTVFLIMQTQSRGAFYGMIIGIIVFLFLAAKNKLTFFIVSVLSIGLIALFWSQISSLSSLNRILEEGTSRNELWDYAEKVIKENFFVGVGFLSSEFTNHAEGNEGMNYHNSYIGFMVDVGLIGVVFLIAMFGFLLYRILKKIKKLDENDRLFYLGMVALCVAFFGLSYGEGYLLAAGSPFSFVFWCCMFCMLHYNTERDSELAMLDNEEGLELTSKDSYGEKRFDMYS